MNLGNKFYNVWLTNTYKMMINGKPASDLWFEKYDNPDKYLDVLTVDDLKDYFNEVKEYFISFGGEANIRYWNKYDFSKPESILKICDEKEIAKMKDFLWTVKAHLK